MPLEYSSITKEALAVRERCGLFDLSHMGRLKVRDELKKLEYLTSLFTDCRKKSFFSEYL